MMNHSKSQRAWSAFRRCARPARVCALTAAMFFATQAAAQIPDPERGRMLYENHCVVCHTAKVHTRPNRIAVTREEVREIADHWRRQQNLTWSAQDTEDVVEFLGRTRYHFAPGTDRLGKP